MSQICIMNTQPELSVSSCNTVCNSPINCIICVPPYSSFRNSINRKLNKINSLNRTNLSNNKVHAISEHLIRNYFQRQQSIIDYDSSDDDECASQKSGPTAEDTEQPSAVDNKTNEKNSQNFNQQNSVQETKYSTMWIGNNDGK
jgi:hypothetical protein